MKRLTLAALVAAGPAAAHPGGHLHPHGIDTVWIVALSVGAVLAAVGYVRSRR